MKMSIDDLINYLEYESTYKVSYFIGLHHLIINYIEFGGVGVFSKLKKHWTELPDNIVFNDRVDLRNTPFIKIPESTKFLSTVFVESLATLPVLNVGESLILEKDYDIIPGTFVGRKIISGFIKHNMFEDVIINGYVVDGGVLS